MYLIVGLGNPGKKHVSTRHNVGFMSVEFIQAELGLANFKFHHKLKADLSINQLDGQNIILAKPQTYMNESGQAVHLIKSYFKIQPENILVIHDDLDITFGEVRVKHGGSPAGHNGLKSIIEHLGSPDFWRLRVGIKNKQLHKFAALPPDIKHERVAHFVLSNFTWLEKIKLKREILPAVLQSVLTTINKS